MGTAVFTLRKFFLSGKLFHVVLSSFEVYKLLRYLTLMKKSGKTRSDNYNANMAGTALSPRRNMGRSGS